MIIKRLFQFAAATVGILACQTPALAASPVYPAGNNWMGGYAASPAGCTSGGADHVFCAIVGGDGNLWVNRLVSSDPAAIYGAVGRWDGWGRAQSYGTGNPTLAAERPSCVSTDPLNLTCFVKGSDGAMWMAELRNHAGWFYTSLGGVITSAPSCVKMSDARTDCYARGTDNALWMRSSFGGSWRDWTYLGGGVGSQLSCFKVDANLSACAVRNIATGALAINMDSRGARTWKDLGGVIYDEPSCAISPKDARATCVVRGGGNALYRISSAANTLNTWGNWALIPGSLNQSATAPNCATLSTGSLGCMTTQPGGALRFSMLSGASANTATDWAYLWASESEAPSCVARGKKLDCIHRTMGDKAVNQFGWR